VTIGLLRGEFVFEFDVVLQVYAVKIFAGFYKVQYVRIKREVMDCVYRFFSQFSGGMFLPRIGKIGSHLTKLSQYKKGDVFYETVL